MQGNHEFRRIQYKKLSSIKVHTKNRVSGKTRHHTTCLRKYKKKLWQKWINTSIFLVKIWLNPWQMYPPAIFLKRIQEKRVASPIKVETKDRLLLKNCNCVFYIFFKNLFLRSNYKIGYKGVLSTGEIRETKLCVEN